MASQPANTDISVFRRVRAYRNQRRHESVEAIIKRLRPLIMSVPSEEFLTGVLTRDTGTSDFSVWGRDGQPIVIGVLPDTTFAQAQENITGVDFAIQIGADKFLNHDANNIGTRDLHQDTRDLV